MAQSIHNQNLSLQRKLVAKFYSKIKDLEAFRENLWNSEDSYVNGHLEFPEFNAILTPYLQGDDDISGAAEKGIHASHMLKAIFPDSKLNGRITQLVAKVGGYTEPLDAQQAKARTEDAVSLLLLLNAMAEALGQTLRSAKGSQISKDPGLNGVWLCKLNGLLPLETEEGKLAVKAAMEDPDVADLWEHLALY
jgi:hypothetical protein